MKIKSIAATALRLKLGRELEGQPQKPLDVAGKAQACHQSDQSSSFYQQEMTKETLKPLNLDCVEHASKGTSRHI